MTTKAVHLELVTGLDTESYLRALNRFVSRRGRPLVIHSDNAPCFRKAEWVNKLDKEAAKVEENSLTLKVYNTNNEFTRAVQQATSKNTFDSNSFHRTQRILEEYGKQI